MQTKLTLRLEDRLIRQAKAYARRSGKSVSTLVSGYFAALGSPHDAGDGVPLPPQTRSLRGVLKGKSVSEADYRSYLERKHR